MTEPDPRIVTFAEAGAAIMRACEAAARQMNESMRPVFEGLAGLTAPDLNPDAARHRPGDPEW